MGVLYFLRPARTVENMFKIVTALLILTGATQAGNGDIKDARLRIDRKNVTITTRIYGLGAGHEITGSFDGGTHYFNADGVGRNGAPVDCPGYRYKVSPRRGTSTIEVRIPRTCVPGDSGKSATVRLIMLDPSEPGRGIYLPLDEAVAKPRR